MPIFDPRSGQTWQQYTGGGSGIYHPGGAGIATTPTPAATTQASSLANPAPVTVTTPTDPNQQGATDAWKKYQEELESGTAAETQREEQRYRDEISKGMQSEGESAMARGADPSLFRSRALESGKTGLLQLQGNLADVSLGRRAEALSGYTGAAASAANTRDQLQLGTLAAQNAAQQTELAEAELQARLNEAPYDRLLKLMSTMGMYGSEFSGLTGGSGGGGVSAPSWGGL